jgi:hypothetical protein
MRLKSRLDRLEKLLGRADEPCPGGITLMLIYCPQHGDPEPEIPHDTPVCDFCGEPHVLIIRKEIVSAAPTEG